MFMAKSAVPPSSEMSDYMMEAPLPVFPQGGETGIGTDFIP